jgi:hypothetical protein
VSTSTGLPYSLLRFGDQWNPAEFACRIVPIGQGALRVGVDERGRVTDKLPMRCKAARQGRFPGPTFRSGKGDNAEHSNLRILEASISLMVVAL